MLEKNIVDELFSKSLGELERERLWKSAQNILSHRPVGGCSTGLALGYVQSGKTTQMIGFNRRSARCKLQNCRSPAREY